MTADADYIYTTTLPTGGAPGTIVKISKLNLERVGVTSPPLLDNHCQCRQIVYPQLCLDEKAFACQQACNESACVCVHSAGGLFHDRFTR